MHKNNFENEVQQQMEQFVLQPSDMLWQKVSQGIEPKKRITILPYLLAIVFLCCFLYTADIPIRWFGKASGISLNTPSIKNNTAINIAEPANTNANELQTSANKESVTSIHSITSTQKKTVTSVVYNNNISTNKITSQLPTNPTSNLLITKDDVLMKDESLLLPTMVLGYQIQHQTVFDIKVTLKDTNILQPAPSAKSEDDNKRKRTVSLQASMGVGLSNLQYSNKNGQYSFANANTSGGLNPGTGFSSTNPSTTSPKTAPAFNVGLMIKKPIAKKFFLLLGLQYSYYGAYQYAGSKIDSARSIYLDNRNRQDLSSFYRAGQNTKQIDQFHFIELPILVGFNIIQKQNWQMVGTTGLAYAFCFNSRLLLPNSGNYFEAATLVNRSQLFFKGGVDVVIHPNSKHSFIIGPQFSYGISNVVDRDAFNGAHLLYGGIKAGISFLKK